MSKSTGSHYTMRTSIIFATWSRSGPLERWEGWGAAKLPPTSSWLSPFLGAREWTSTSSHSRFCISLPGSDAILYISLMHAIGSCMIHWLTRTSGKDQVSIELRSCALHRLKLAPSFRSHILPLQDNILCLWYKLLSKYCPNQFQFWILIRITWRTYKNQHFQSPQIISCCQGGHHCPRLPSR